MSLKKEPLQIVEIDIDYCSLTYGGAPCTAALGGLFPRKCYNTFFTCQDQTNYSAGTLTLRFAQNQTGLPKGTIVYPALAGPVSTNPTEVNLGGVGDKLGSLGKRARVNIKLKDFTDSDIYTDKYRADRLDGTGQTDEGGYNPQDRGTFFGKLRRRWPYYLGRPLRVLEGYTGDSLASMRTRHYVITQWSGPDHSGNVAITAQDVLTLADDKKAQCPQPSRGKLETAIADATELPTINLLPAGIGSEYAASGRASIGSEIVTFTRSSDAITITARGVDGSDGASHSADSVFQECYYTSGSTIQAVIADLLENYANIDPAFLPTTNWAAEINRWVPYWRLTRTIAKPTGVTKLIGEILQLGIMLWWDDIAQEIKLRINRPVDLTETLAQVSDATNILEGSLKNSELQSKRLSRVLFWHGVIDYSDTTSAGKNYKKLLVAIDEDAESSDEYGEIATFEVFNPWLGPDGDDQLAQAVSVRLRNRYRNPPREVQFDVDVKDEATLRTADLLALTTRALQDETGNSIATQMQISSVEEVSPGHKLRVTAEEWDFAGRYCFITEAGRSDYGSSTAAEIAKGTYIVDAGTLLFSDGTGPYLMF